MATILYARVSTAEQAARDLSIPAQLRTLRRYAEEQEWYIAGTYQDVASGRSFHGRPGLLAAIQHCKQDKSVDTLLVHKIDRVSRNTYNYLALRGELRAHGVRIVSVVEHLEAGPLGEFIEQLMAAQAQFYSANLAEEVKKGHHERLRRGYWNGIPPVGYVREHGHILVDPARGPFMKRAFTQWAEGTVTASTLADEVHRAGLVGVHGKQIRANQLCRLLKNPFYMGVMVVNGQRFPGKHPPLISPSLFKRCQEVFGRKLSGRRDRSKLVFLLSRKVKCPRCARFLVGEQHAKPSGRCYRYYRCHDCACGFTTRADELEQEVLDTLRGLNLAKKLTPLLCSRLRSARRRRSKETADEVRRLRSHRRGHEKAHQELMRSFVKGHVSLEDYEIQEEELRNGIWMTDWFLNSRENLHEPEHGDATLLELFESLDERIRSEDPTVRRQAVDAVVHEVLLFGESPRIHLKKAVRELLPPPNRKQQPD